jgi:hypothetical protein
MSTTLAVQPRLTVQPTLTIRPAGPTIRVRPVPRSEPPSDAELIAASLEAPPMTAPQLPLELPGTRTLRPKRRRTPPAETADLVATAVSEPHPVRLGPDPQAEVELSPARLATRRFLSMFLEVVGGFRPVTHLRPFCQPERFIDIADRLAAHPATGPAWRRQAAQLTARTPVTGRVTGGPPRAGRANQTAPVDRVSVRRVQVCEAIDNVAEVAVVLARRDQVWAVALRLECHRGRWLCAHLDVL